MPSICLYFQIHQPFRLRKFSLFDSTGTGGGGAAGGGNYFDNAMNAQLVRRIAEKCYRPMNRLLLDLIARHQGKFRLAFSVTGTALEQFEAYAPEVLQGLHALAETRCVEFLGETYYHSLSALRTPPHTPHAPGAAPPPLSPPAEFRAQVDLHRRMITRLFNQTPTIFRNTELIYSNAIGAMARQLGFNGILAEGWDPVLNNRSAAFMYRAVAPHNSPAPAGPPTPSPAILLLRNYRLSDAIAFQFADTRSPDFPLTAEKFAQHVAQIGGPLCNLFMDYETFGEHQAAATGIFDFFRGLPAKLFEHNCDFRLPSELIPPNAGIGDIPPVEAAGELDVPQPISWADIARDLGAWMGNAMQVNAIDDLYALEQPIKSKGDLQLLADWRKLTTSDHFYYMSTKGAADGSVHSYFRPYESPYDAYINFMNVIDSMKSRASA